MKFRSHVTGEICGRNRPTGGYVYYMRGDAHPEKCSIWRMPAGGGEETRVIDPFQCDAGWHVGETGIFLRITR